MRLESEMQTDAKERAEFPPHVLAVDDDPTVRSLIVDYLGRNDVRVTAVADGRSMRKVLEQQVVDLVLLDPGLQSEDGMNLARRLREDSAIPIIMLTARRDEADRVMGLELGADDYLTKPFSTRELLARIRSVLRRNRIEARQGRAGGVRGYRFAGWELNLHTRRLIAPGGRAVALSKGDFNLLVVLLSAPRRVLSRDQLLDLSRLHTDDVDKRSIDVQIMRLRKKLESEPGAPRHISTERGVGYVFNVGVEVLY